MTTKFISNTPHQGLYCVWIKTGNPRQPLACIWIDPQVRSYALEYVHQSEHLREDEQARRQGRGVQGSKGTIQPLQMY